MTLIQLKEQIADGQCLSSDIAADIIPYLEEGKDIVYTVKNGKDTDSLCLSLRRQNNNVYAHGSYFIGIDWLSVNNAAIQVSPKMNDGYEVDSDNASLSIRT